MLPFPVNPVLEEIAVYQPGRPIEEVARELGLPSANVIKLASNENPLGPSPKAVAAMRKALDHIHLYPDGNAHYLKHKLAQPGEVVVVMAGQLGERAISSSMKLHVVGRHSESAMPRSNLTARAWAVAGIVPS